MTSAIVGKIVRILRLPSNENEYEYEYVICSVDIGTTQYKGNTGVIDLDGDSIPSNNPDFMPYYTGKYVYLDSETMSIMKSADGSILLTDDTVFDIGDVVEFN